MSNAPKLRKLALTSGIVAVMAALLGLGTYAAFTATTQNDGNTFASGTVAISDNDGGSTPLYVKSNQKPGDVTESCIKVTYTGSLAASVKLYMSSVTNGGDYNLVVERGTQSTGVFPACGNFSATSTAFTGTLGGFATAHTGFADGLVGKAAGAAWATNDELAYKFTLTQNDDTTPNGRTSVRGTGTHTITWEAQNN